MLSSNGSASVAPRPRSIARREMCSFSMNIEGPLWNSVGRLSRPPHRERPALHDAEHERRPLILGAFHLANKLADGRRVVVAEPAAERVGQELLRDGVRELIGLREQRLAKRFRAVDLL